MTRMATLVTRDEWGAAPPRSVSHNVTPTEGVAIHHVGAGSYANIDHARCVSLVQSIQRMHMANTTENYVDIAYNLLACHHGYLFEGRSKADDPKVRPGSNGTSHANTVAMSVCCLWGDADGDPNPGILAAAADGVAWLRKHAKAADRVTGHRDWSSTGCPGHLYPKLGTIKALADRADDPADRDKERPVPYKKITRDINVPAKTWVKLGHVASVERGPGLYVAQLAVVKGRGSGWAQVRFSRNGKNGTGDQDYVYRFGKGVHNISHNHALLGGFDGRMDTLFWSSRRVTIKYTILKSIAL